MLLGEIGNVGEEFPWFSEELCEMKRWKSATLTDRKKEVDPSAHGYKSKVWI